MDEAIVDKVAARILARMNGEAIDARPRSVIAIFSGAVSGFAAGREAVSRLVRSSHALSVLLTPSARQIFGEQAFRDTGAASILELDPWADVSEHICRADLVLVPTLTMNLAARLALGMMDSPAATLILGALLAGKSVLAIRDGADPAGKRGAAMGAIPEGSPVLWRLLEARLETLASFGMELTAKDDFLFALERRLIAASAARPSAPAKPPAVAVLPVNVGSLPTIITSLEIQEQAPGSRMLIARGRRLTPQAKDFAARLGLQLEFA
jgi:hypothetical protein